MTNPKRMTIVEFGDYTRPDYTPDAPEGGPILGLIWATVLGAGAWAVVGMVVKILQFLLGGAA